MISAEQLATRGQSVSLQHWHVVCGILFYNLCCALPCSRWAFSIWGLIFALQGAGVVYQATSTGYQMTWKRSAVETIGEQAGLQTLAFRLST